MNDTQKARIAKLREAGKGYAAIAALLDLNENSVKTYCRRHGLGGMRAVKVADDEHFCKNCGEPVRQIPGKKQKIFCSAYCRNAWWNSHLNLVKRKAYYEYECPTCHKAFKVYANRARKYCCHECYIIDRFGGDGHEKD